MKLHKNNKNTADSSTLPGMIAPSGVLFLFLLFFFSALLCSSCPLTPFLHTHGCLPDVKRGISGFNDITNAFLYTQPWLCFDWCNTVSALSYKESCQSSSIESSVLAGDEACLPYLIICLVGKPQRLIRYHL